MCYLSHLLGCAFGSAYELTDGDHLEKGLVGLTLHHTEGAKGLEDAPSIVLKRKNPGLHAYHCATTNQFQFSIRELQAGYAGT